MHLGGPASHITCGRSFIATVVDVLFDNEINILSVGKLFDAKAPERVSANKVETQRKYLPILALKRLPCLPPA